MRLRHVAETLTMKTRQNLTVKILKICLITKLVIVEDQANGNCFPITIWDIQTPFSETKDAQGCPIRD